MKLFHGSNVEIDNVDVGPVADDAVRVLIRQFSRGTIDAEYMKKEFLHLCCRDNYCKQNYFSI